MKLNKALQRFKDRIVLGDSYWVELAKISFAHSLERQRLRKGLTYAAIAEKIKASPPYISKVFRGDANMTIETMVKLSRAVGGQYVPLISDLNEGTSQQWVRIIQAVPAEASNQTINTAPTSSATRETKINERLCA